jgi:hypothetical protein
MPASRRGAVAGAREAAEPESPPSTVREGPVAATAVVVGDCLTGIVIGAAERAEIDAARVVSCDREHAFEVYATFALDGAELDPGDDADDYPGRARVVRAADEGCTERIAELVEDPDTFGLIALWPSPRSWAEGDRDVACAIFSPDGSPFDRRQL